MTAADGDPDTAMANHTGPQFGNIQNADKIYNYANDHDWLAAGQRFLSERNYRRAVRCFEDFLNSTSSESEVFRAEAHVLLAVAMLAGSPPSYRTPQQITDVARHLLASRTPLASVLAALIRDDFYLSAGIAVPPDLARLADGGDPVRLNRTDLVLVKNHIAAVPGYMWRRLSAHCASVGIHLPTVPPNEETPPATPDRRIGVPKYFVALPAIPPTDRGFRASVTMAAGIALIFLPCAGLFVRTEWYVGLALLVAAPLAGIVVTLIGISVWRDAREDRAAQVRYEEAVAASSGAPNDEQMDRWLSEDVRWIVARGARRLRLNPALVAASGDLLVEPQAAVGVSQLEEETVEQVSWADGSTSTRLVRQRTKVGKSKVGRDGKLRSDHYQVLVLYLTTHRISVFMCDLVLATRYLRTEATYTFHYRDVVSTSSRTIVHPRSSTGGISVFDDKSGRYVRRYADNHFTLFLVNGQQLDISVGVSGDSKELEVAWSNSQVFHVVDRMVWSRKEREDADRQ
ncbi:hypothetical protein [Micromonospora profundi]|uniref:hypothetical protein n=1 Tax=Micromonospora profundi TaxID=1420889 RepID=UPI00365C22FC